jgi:hypothetical protein
VRRAWCRAARLASLALAAGCAVCITSFLGGVALADPPPSPVPAPEPSANSPGHSAPAAPNPQRLKLALSTLHGGPGSSFTATATDIRACDQLATAVAGYTIVFEWPFGQQSKTADYGSVAVTFTVPDDAAPDTYKVSASCAGLDNVTATATFTVLQRPSVSLEPQQGAPTKTHVTATVSGFDACLGDGSTASQTVSWQWDGEPLLTSVGADGSTVTFDVPADARPTAEHTVTASCGETSAKAPFTVIPIATPALTLDTGQGPRGSQLTASGTGFACGDDRVTVLWDGETAVGDGPSGTFSIALTVPEDASLSRHTVVASCRSHADVTDTQSFVVTEESVEPAAAAALALTPARGSPGSNVHLSGDRFACRDARIVQLSWDGQPLTNSTADASGHFDASISVPANADVNSHIVRAACEAGSAVATAGFSVVASGTIPPTIPETTTSTPKQKSSGITAWLLLIFVGVLAVLALRHWRKQRRKPTRRIYAWTSPNSGLPVVSASDTPARGEASHALRLQIHADLGTQTLSEVDSDHAT